MHVRKQHLIVYQHCYHTAAANIESLLLLQVALFLLHYISAEPSRVDEAVKAGCLEVRGLCVELCVGLC